MCKFYGLFDLELLLDKCSALLTAGGPIVRVRLPESEICHDKWLCEWTSVGYQGGHSGVLYRYHPRPAAVVVRELAEASRALHRALTLDCKCSLWIDRNSGVTADKACLISSSQQ
eukprot:9434654-Pyramimonas_sp.AAC.1